MASLSRTGTGPGTRDPGCCLLTPALTRVRRRWLSNAVAVRRRTLRGWLAAAVLILPALAAPAADEAPEAPGGWRLATESSPYLQLHADNPVTWYPWGEAAFERARQENKPLFISIGYYTCHWCHVMARESFEDPAIAKLLNEHFIAVKVDREQRPDIDAAYMRYVSLTRGHAGWPLSVWATPDGSPFVGATYIPPDELRGRPGMKQLLPKLVALWRDEEAKVRMTAAQAVATLRRLSVSAQPLEELTMEPLVQARHAYVDSFDELQGGFGPAPKFPEPARLLFLLQDDEPASHEMALLTLDHMAAGGINDQLAGGFHRYSTDFDWHVPHFEKMLYDQALLARAYLYAWRLTGDQAYAATARATLDFALAVMRHPGGGFIAALSADSATGHGDTAHTEEGAGYTWSWKQLQAALPDPDMRDWAAARYGLEVHGNAVGDQQDELGGRNVLYRALDDRELARQFGVDLDTVRQRNAAVDQRLRAARAQRPPVPQDDKVVAAWNGYMITTLALAGAWLNDPRYTQAAEAAATFVTGTLYDRDRIILYRDWRNGVLGSRAFAGDYAAVAEGLLTLYGVTGDKHWLHTARTLVEMQLALFRDPEHGGFYSTAADSELWLREKPLSDGATLSVNGVALHALLLLADHGGDTAYLETAWETAAWAGAQLASSPEAMPYSLIPWRRLLTLNARQDAATAKDQASPAE